VPILDRSDGTIFLLVNYYPPPYQDVPVHVWLMKSSDEGATWSSPVDITAGTGLKELGPGIGIQMQNGKLVVPTYDGVIFSDDHGETWKSGGKISGLYNETQVVELTDGSLMLNIRKGGHRAIAISKDGGQTWSEPQNDRTLTDPKTYRGSQASVIRYTRKKDGYSKDRLLFSNPAYPNDRFDMTVRISYDEGKTWPVAKLIKKGTGAYSCLTILPDGTIGLVYESGNIYGDVAEDYSWISFVRFNLEWLTNGQDHLTASVTNSLP
jgi:sialidase-1